MNPSLLSGEPCKLWGEGAQAGYQCGVPSAATGQHYATSRTSPSYQSAANAAAAGEFDWSHMEADGRHYAHRGELQRRANHVARQLQLQLLLYRYTMLLMLQKLRFYRCTMLLLLLLLMMLLL